MPIANIIPNWPSLKPRAGRQIRLNSIYRFNFLPVLLVGITLIFAKGCGGGGNDSNAVTTGAAAQKNAEFTLVEQDNKSSVEARNYLNKGFERLKNRDIIKANYYFKKSDQAKSTDASKFFRAFTDLAIIYFDTKPDNTADGLQDIGDFLDAFGVGSAGRSPWRQISIDFPKPLPAHAPTGQDIKNFLYKKVRPVLINDVKLFDKISKKFQQKWNEPVVKNTVESDYGDVLALRALVKLHLSIIYIQQAYYLNAVFSSANIEQFLNNDVNFMLIANRSYLSKARSYLRGADDDLNSAIDYVRKEKDNQRDDFINMMGTSVKDIDQVKTLIRAMQSSLNGRGSVSFRHKGLFCSQFSIHDSRKARCFNMAGPSSVVTQINLDPLFDGLDLRALLPAFQENHPIGFFPDPTFGGTVLKIKNRSSAFFNDDLNNNGIADIFE